MNSFAIAAFVWLQLTPFRPASITEPVKEIFTYAHPLTVFTAEPAGKHTVLKWTVAENETVSGFEIVKKGLNTDLVLLKKISSTPRIGFEVYRLTITCNSNDHAGLFIRVIQKGQATTSDVSNSYDLK